MMDLREIMINTLDKCGTLDSYVKEDVYTEQVEMTDIDLATEITREDVITYLKESGSALTDDSFAIAEKYLKKQVEEGKTNLTKKVAKEKTVLNHLYDYSDDELKVLLGTAILNKLCENSNGATIQYEYVVEKVYDKAGATDTYEMSKIMTKYSSKGYRVVSIFTNELGKNAVSVGGIGVNATSDEVVIVFERPVRKAN